METTKYESLLELKKHINAIHCSGNLTLVQRKLFNALLFHSYQQLPVKSQFTIPVQQLCKLVGYNSNDYAKLKKALLALITLPIEWDVLNSEDGFEKRKWSASAALASAKLENGLCSFEYSAVMRELLYKPEIYGRINMRIVAQFKSSYGLALYENCIRYQGLPQTPAFSLPNFRKLMGVADTQYVTFNFFKRRVLSIAIKEVNTYSHLAITPEIERKNQKVISIRFKLSVKVEDKRTEEISQPINDNAIVVELIKQFKLSAKVINKLLSQYPIDYIKEKIKLIQESSSFRSGKINDLAGYLIDALQKDYQMAVSSTRLAKKIQQSHIKQEAIEKENSKQEEVRKRLYEDYLNSVSANYIATLAEAEKQEVIDLFQASLKAINPIIHNFYIKHGLASRPVQEHFNHFIIAQMNLPGVLTYAEFNGVG